MFKLITNNDKKATTTKNEPKNSAFHVVWLKKVLTCVIYMFIFLLFVGLYCSGWIAHGPVFVILGTMNDGFATGKTVLEDIASGQLTCENLGGKESIISILQQKGIQ